MADSELAGRIAAEVLDRKCRRIQVSNVHRPEILLSRLDSLLENTRIIPIDFHGDDPLRTALSDYFSGSSFPDPETAFEARWQSHITEIALFSGGSGMVTAAGLYKLKEPLKLYILQGGNDPSVISGILSSFSKTLPTLLFLQNYSGNSLFDDPSADLPPVVAVTVENQHLPFPDLVLDSGLMPVSAIGEYLREQGCEATSSAVIQATGRRAGFVELYAGISRVHGLKGDDIVSVLNQVLDANTELSDFAAASAVLAPGFIPDEAGAISDTPTGKAFQAGKLMNLWRGFRVCSFFSPEVRDAVLQRLSNEERTDLLLRAAETIPRLRGESSVSLGLSGDLLLRAGAVSEAALMFQRAAELERGELKKAELYRKAAMLNQDNREECVFKAAVSLYREECADETPQVPAGTAEEEYPELSPVISRAYMLHDKGLHHSAETLLAEFSLRGGMHLPVGLWEMGRLLYRRNMIEASLNVLKSAVFHAREEGAQWIEVQALFTMAKACSRAGRFTETERIIGRLLELTVDSGNRRRLVSIYNLYANFLILQTRYEMALKVYSSSLRTLGNRQQNLRSIILNNMSIAQRRLFRTSDALGSLMRLVGSAVSQGNLHQASTAYGNMARLFIDLSEFDSARDCLESMLEFRRLTGSKFSDDSVLFISSQIAFAEGNSHEALSLIHSAASMARVSGNLRRLSLNLVKMGSMLLRLGKFHEAAVVLSEAEQVSLQSNSALNAYVARMKCTASRCFNGELAPWNILSLSCTGNPEAAHRGEQFYYHWRLTGSRQSLTAAAQLLSRGLVHGLHYHSYLYMLHEIGGELPRSLADALPLVHNYPSCDLTER